MGWPGVPKLTHVVLLKSAGACAVYVYEVFHLSFHRLLADLLLPLSLLAVFLLFSVFFISGSLWGGGGRSLSERCWDVSG